MAERVMERKAAREAGRRIEGRVVTGFPSIIGNVDDGGDLIEPGSFLKTIGERAGRVRWLWGHDQTLPPIARVVEMAEVGRSELPEEVLAKAPSATGALLVKREYLDTPRANEVLAAIVAGAQDEMSFGYDAIQVEFPKGLTVGGRQVKRRLKEIRLWEFSDVLWGMNPATGNLKAAVERLLAELPQTGPERQKALANWLESRLHLHFTEIADELYGDGRLTREERIALSGLISDALNAFNAGMTASGELGGVRVRGFWEQAPSTPLHSAQDAQSGQPQLVTAQELLRRRVDVLRKGLELV